MVYLMRVNLLRLKMVLILSMSLESLEMNDTVKERQRVMHIKGIWQDFQTLLVTWFENGKMRSENEIQENTLDLSWGIWNNKCQLLNIGTTKIREPDGDGSDSGETIELAVTIKNRWGKADPVK